MLQSNSTCGLGVRDSGWRVLAIVVRRNGGATQFTTKSLENTFESKTSCSQIKRSPGTNNVLNAFLARWATQELKIDVGALRGLDLPSEIESSKGECCGMPETL